MKTLLITRPLPDPIVEAARAHFDVTVRDIVTPLSVDETVAALGTYDAMLPTLGDPLSAETFAKVPEMRTGMIANFGVGYNHIDVGAAREAGISVSNTPGAVTEATADIALTLILMTARGAGAGERMVRSGKWDGWHPTQLLGMHLGEKTLGIIGMGRIGKAIARRAHLGLGMDVVFHNRSRVTDAGVPARQLDTLAEVCGVSDVVVIAVPATPETRHMMNAEAFAAMQSHAIFVNIARGDVMDEAALVAALQSGQIGGAGLDVYEREPIVSPELLTMDNVTLLPHLGTAALEVRTNMGMMAVENLVAWLEGRDLPNGV